MKWIFLSLFTFSLCSVNHAQADRWQQHAKYKMDIDFDVKTNQFTGKQTIKYTNNSPDDLNRIFYHLFFNAFQPGSMMDEKSLNVSDPDKRVGDRISKLQPEEYGWQKVNSLTLNGKACNYIIEGTILEVDLPMAIKAGETVELVMDFEAQVPIQIRRSGRDSKEGIRYSMTQWYPRLCEYDYQGWHAHPYVGREFHGIWGDFDVKITIHKDYILGGSGVLQNANDIGYGYSSKEKGKFKLKKKRTWHFLAENVIDFAWAADPDYTHLVRKAEGVTFHYLYQKNQNTEENWEKLHSAVEKALPYINEHFGAYPFPVYSVIQGGDGGMEYPMCTLITGERSFSSLVGVTVHELMHSWYQMILGTNEALYPWMDEGFTSYASARVMNHLKKEGIIEGEPQKEPMYNSIRNFGGFALSGMEEPLSTHADHYTTNTAYGAGSYTKGSVFLSQIEYIIGKEAFDKGMLSYYDTWKFKHPNPNDFIRIMEKESGLELDWFKEYFINTTHFMDYGVDTLASAEVGTVATLHRYGRHPMPIDALVTLKDGREVMYHIPLTVMRGEKADEGMFDEYHIAKDWPWTRPVYELPLPYNVDEIEFIILDPTGRMADVSLDNNIYPKISPEDNENQGK